MYNSFFKHGGYFEVPDVLYEVTGEKAASFLHGQLTNHIKGLKIGEANYNLLLTQKGKIVGDLFVYCLAEKMVLAINPLFFEKIIDHLNKLAPLSRVEIKKVADWKMVHVCRGEALPRPGRPNGSPLQFPTNRIGFPGYDILVSSVPWVPSDTNLIEMNSELIEVLRVEQGIPKIGVDVTEDNLPQEGRVERALHFNKGCYLGQEIVARLQYRGHVNKILVGLKLPSLVARDSSLDKTQITSQIFSPKLGAPLALGYVPYGSDDARIVKLPLHDFPLVNF